MNGEAHPVNRRFATLDRYLLYLRQFSGPSDGPWYKEIRPGVYELQTGNRRTLRDHGEAEKQVFTREELMKKFGFSK